MLKYKYIMIYLFIHHILVYWSFSTLLYYFDINNYFSKFRFISPRKDVNLKIIRDVIFNQLLLIPLSMMSKYVFNICEHTEEYKSISFPFFFFVSYIAEEIAFYYSHRMLHTKFLFKYHQKHHNYYNCIATLYCSPLEFLFSNVFPTMLGPFLIGLISSYPASYLYYWNTLALLNSIWGHSPFSLKPNRYPNHYLHHLYVNVNYGTSNLLDKLHNTYYYEEKIEK
jgi:fatty acid hydroxylase domain-containing protein 2